MPIVMKVGGITATYIGQWTSWDPDSQFVIDELNDLMHAEPGPSGSDPNPDLTQAK